MMLKKALLDLSNQPNRQIIVTTRVPALAGLMPIEGIRYVTKDENGNLADDLGLPWCVFLDSDIGGGPEQVASITKRKQEVEAQGRPFYSTRKREIENYLCPEMIYSRRVSGWLLPIRVTPRKLSARLCVSRQMMSLTSSGP